MDVLDPELYEHKRLLKKYNKRINIARVCLYITTAIGTVITFMHSGESTFTGNLLTTGLFIVVCIASHPKPFLSLSVVSLVFVYFMCTVSFRQIYAIILFPDIGFATAAPIIANTAISLVSIFFSIRGAVAGWKYERLITPEENNIPE